MAASPLLIEVRAPRGAVGGTLAAAGRRFACALGRAGIVTNKREGDGGTPAGRFLLREALWRPDRGPAPATGLPLLPIEPDDGWCDDAADRLYNCKVRLPYPGRCERLWRDDSLYDALAVIGWNDDPAVPGRGSAIFLHLARAGAEGFEPTEGCVALGRDDLRAVLAHAGPGALIDIAAV
jgi:L,D-peptidoglycan transpeptidase YkuD (ErfK/YbiS/YcfS/YnhG family)